MKLPVIEAVNPFNVLFHRKSPSIISMLFQLFHLRASSTTYLILLYDLLLMATKYNLIKN